MKTHQPLGYSGSHNHTAHHHMHNGYRKVVNSPHQQYRRHRRKLPSEGVHERQLNSIDDNRLQYQEYQGVFGKPGVDFPILARIPVTKFNCRNVPNSNKGYYADLETNCQVFHVCDGGRKVSFLCPNGTLFRQSHLICDWWFRVECHRSPELYDQSVHQLESDQNAVKLRSQTMNHVNHNGINGASTFQKSPAPRVTPPQSFNSESNLPQHLPEVLTGFTPSSPNQISSLDGSVKTTSATGSSSFASPSQQTFPATFDQQFPNQETSFIGNSGAGFFNNPHPTHIANGKSQFGSVWEDSPTRFDLFGTDPPSNSQPNIFPLTSLPPTFQDTKYTTPTPKFTATFQPPRTPVSPTLPPIIPTSGLKNKKEKNLPFTIQVKNSFSSSSDSLPSNYYKENQILSETAGIANDGKFPALQNYYYNQNFINQASKSSGMKTTPTTVTSFPSSTPTTFDWATTTNLYNNLFETTFSSDDNNTLALYYPANQVSDYLNLTQQNDFKASVSEFALNVPLLYKPQKTIAYNPPYIPNSLTDQTKDSYNKLFPKTPTTTTTNAPSSSSTLKNSDLFTEFSNGPMQSDPSKTKFTPQSLNTNTNPENSANFRELAQIFSRALSAYLEDPEQFRKILTEVRPTEPSPTNVKDNVEDELLNYSDDVKKFPRPIHVPSLITTPASTSSGFIQPEAFAEEINNFMFDHTGPGYSNTGDFNANPTSPSSDPIPTISLTVSPILDYSSNNSIRSIGSTKANFYDDFFTSGSQFLEEEPILQTADSQSFFAPDNLVHFQSKNSKQYNSKSLGPPNLKTSSYPQFGRRTSSANTINSRSDLFSDSTKQTSIQWQTTIAPTAPTSDANILRSTNSSPITNRRNSISSSARTPSKSWDLNSSTDKTPSNRWNTISSTDRTPSSRWNTISSTDRTPSSRWNTISSTDRTPSNRWNTISSTDKTPSNQWNSVSSSARTTSTQWNSMNATVSPSTSDAKNNKLVLLLVNDTNTNPSSSDSAKGMKSKLLKALLIPPSTKSPSSAHPVNRRRVRKEGRVHVTTPLNGNHKFASSTPFYIHAESYTTLRPSLGGPSSNARSGRSTASSSSPSQISTATVTAPVDTDSRAIDLLKTLYSIAANNWS